MYSINELQRFARTGDESAQLELGKRVVDIEHLEDVEFYESRIIELEEDIEKYEKLVIHKV